MPTMTLKNRTTELETKSLSMEQRMMAMEQRIMVLTQQIEMLKEMKNHEQGIPSMPDLQDTPETHAPTGCMGISRIDSVVIASNKSHPYISRLRRVT